MITALSLAVMQDAAELTVDDPAFVVIRFARYAGLLALIGPAAFMLAAAARARAAHPDFVRTVSARAVVIAKWGALTLFASSLLRLAAQIISIGGVSSAHEVAMYKTVLLRTMWGRAWIIEVGATLFAMWALSRVRSGKGWPLVLVAAPVLALAAALSGHAIALELRTELAVVFDAVHVLAAAGWAGGLATLVFAGIPAAMRADGGTESLATLARAFSPLALTCAAALTFTGVGGAWMQMGGFDAVGSHTYGRALLIKLGVIGGMAALGAYNWRRVLPSLGTAAGAARLQRSARTELAFAVVILLVTAVLVATPTPLESAH